MTPIHATATRIRRAQGFSLIELMVSVIAGMLVIAAVLAFTVSSVRSNAEFVTTARLTQELRGAMDFATRELRRAGYDQNYMAQISRKAGATDQSDFSPILLSGDDCVIYAYDRQPGTPGEVDPENGEVRGLRWTQVGGVGVLEAATSSTANPTLACNNANADYTTYPPACVGAWCAITDPRTLDVTDFDITDVSPGVILGTGTAVVPMRIREFEVVIEGNLVGNTDVARRVQSRVRVRADCLRSGATAAAVTTACTAIPSTAP